MSGRSSLSRTFWLRTAYNDSLRKNNNQITLMFPAPSLEFEFFLRYMAFCKYVAQCIFLFNRSIQRRYLCPIEVINVFSENDASSVVYANETCLEWIDRNNEFYWNLFNSYDTCIDDTKVFFSQLTTKLN